VFRSHAENLSVFSGKGNPYGAPIEAPGAPWSAARVRVFSQRDQLTLDLPELLRATQRFFDATLEVRSRAQSASGDLVHVFLRCDKYGYEGTLTIQSRQTTSEDLFAARAAEQRGHAAGMSTLAERCPTIWEVNSVGVDSELARLNLCGILASVALGPVLPDDGATIYGVRGAMERVEKLLQAPQA
jgi:hypothetical protein